jgi:phosphoglycerol transferase MdoB-like AlkP superfamily enzyme
LPEPQYSALAPKWPDPARDIPNPNPLTPKHVVVIEIESLSASFMQAYGSEKDNITPNLDRLTGESIWFSDLYATGTRTVRGLEGLSVALPPLPGQSIVRREHNDHLYTLGSMLRKKDFEPMFLYGGYGAFDNMNAFFRANGYRISDRENFTEANQNFATIWGVADELLFNEALDQLERDSASGQKRFLHIMTTSNHRPYVYPGGHIDIPSKTGRKGAVKYTDWAIGDFLARAARRPWFKDTLFIIVADHNASVAGKQSLPPNKYRIPAMLYWPAKLAPRRIDGMASQIDLPPTVLALLGIRTGGVFFGQNLLGPAPEPRAFLVNYQELGYLTPTADGQRQLIVLGPKKRVESFAVDAEGELVRISGQRAEEDRAVALFQKANEIFTGGKLHPPQP